MRRWRGRHPSDRFISRQQPYPAKPFMDKREQEAQAQARFERAKQARIAHLERRIADLQAEMEAIIEADWIAYLAEDAGCVTVQAIPHLPFDDPEWSPGGLPMAADTEEVSDEPGVSPT
jgi:hypothetical protein